MSDTLTLPAPAPAARSRAGTAAPVGYHLRFAVPVRLYACAPLPWQARAGARRLLLDDQTRLRHTDPDPDPRIEEMHRDGTDRCGRTRFAVHATLRLIVTAAGATGSPGAAARRQLVTDLAHLHGCRPDLAAIRQIQAPHPDDDWDDEDDSHEDDSHEYDDEWDDEVDDELDSDVDDEGGADGSFTIVWDRVLDAVHT